MKNASLYKETILFAVVLTLLAMSANAAEGDFVWAAALTGSSTENINSITVDDTGNVYITGNFPSMLDFDPDSGLFKLLAKDLDDTFVAKYDNTGALVWVKAVSGAGEEYSYGIALDSKGNVYISGFFRDETDFDPGPGVFNLTSAGYRDVFVLKLDKNGDFVWVKVLGGMEWDGSFDIAVDGEDNVYATGYFRGTAGLGIYSVTSAGESDIFVLKLNSAGDVLWVKAVGGTGPECGNAITADDAGNVYITGFFGNTADFNPGSEEFNLTPAGLTDTFVLKLDSNGAFIWAKATSGVSHDEGTDIVVDKAGNIYTTGFFGGPTDFDPGPDTFQVIPEGWDFLADFDPSPGTCNMGEPHSLDIFVLKLNSSGAFVWARAIGGTGRDYGYGIAVDSTGNVYTTGDFWGIVDFDPGPDTFNLAPTGFEDMSYFEYYEPKLGDINLPQFRSMVIFVLKLDTAGDFAWAKAIGGSGLEMGKAITVDKMGNIFITGVFESTVDFDLGPGTFNLTSKSWSDIFVLKLSGSPDVTPPGISISIPSVNQTTLGPITYLVSYSDADAITLSEDDITLNVTDDVTASVSVTHKGEFNYEVLLSDITGAGMLDFTIASGTAADAAGNLAPGVSTDNPVQVISPPFWERWSTTHTFFAVQAVIVVFLIVGIVVYARRRNRRHP